MGDRENHRQAGVVVECLRGNHQNWGVTLLVPDRGIQAYTVDVAPLHLDEFAARCGGVDPLTVLYGGAIQVASRLSF